MGYNFFQKKNIKEKRPIRRPEGRWRDNIKTNFEEIIIDLLNWINRA
jgi:hypothetical protein